MGSSPAPKNENAWSGLGRMLLTMLAVGAFITLSHIKRGESSGRIGVHVLIMLGCTLAIFAIAFLVIAVIAVFQMAKGLAKLAEEMSESVSLVSVDPMTAFPSSDHQLVAALGAELEALGFQRMVYYMVDHESQKAKMGSGYAALYLHPTQQCFAEVMQVFKPDGSPTPVRCSINNYFTDGWALSSTAQAAIPESSPFRRPRKLWSAYPNTPIAEVYARHLAQRARMLQDLGITILPDFSFTWYAEQQNRSQYERKEIMMKRNAFGMVLAIQREKLFTRTHWDGEYAEVARQRKLAEKVVQ